MSRRSGATGQRRRKARTQGWGDGHSEIAIVAAWCADETDLTEAKQVSHDQVIARLGDARTGGVRWSISTGADALERLTILEREGGEGPLTELRTRLIDHGGILVLAMAPGRRGAS